MGGGDLNLKKRWHPAKYENMQKVWEVQQQQKQEQQKVEILRKEIAKEREIAEIKRQQEQAGFIQAPRQQKLEWMYTNPSSSSGNSNAKSSLSEDYLLGKKPVTELLDGRQQPLKGSLHAEKITIAKRKDLHKKIKEDPLFVIKKRQIG